jgi:hypothetical protein
VLRNQDRSKATVIEARYERGTWRVDPRMYVYGYLAFLTRANDDTAKEAASMPGHDIHSSLSNA